MVCQVFMKFYYRLGYFFVKDPGLFFGNGGKDYTADIIPFINKLFYLGTQIILHGQLHKAKACCSSCIPNIFRTKHNLIKKQ